MSAKKPPPIHKFSHDKNGPLCGLSTVFTRLLASWTDDWTKVTCRRCWAVLWKGADADSRRRK